MAVLCVITGRNSTPKQLKGIINYVKNDAKTMNGELIYGKDVLKDKEYEDMMNVKSQYGKDMPGTGRFYIHMTISFSKDDPGATKENVFNVGKEIVNRYPDWENNQVLMACHIGGSDNPNPHIHLVINNVADDGDKGKKFANNKDQTEALKQLTNEVCQEFGCWTMDFTKKERKEKTWDSKEFQAQQHGRSWKQSLQAAINQSAYASANKDQFLANMGLLGYQVKWREDYKYITFQTPKNKLCRNNKLFPPDAYTKEALLEKFEQVYDRETTREIRSAIYEAQGVSLNKDQFINNMRKLGYETEWNEETREVKISNSRKSYPNGKLESKIETEQGIWRDREESEKRYTMDKLEERFAANKERNLTGAVSAFAELARNIDERRANGEDHPLNAHLDMTAEMEAERKRRQMEGESIWSK
jgi:hypothetical protein